MPADEVWSDSDEEVLSDTETSVQLGLPDGPIESSSDMFDAAVSRIGGHPAFLTREPSLDCARCNNCSHLMELLVQLWCPLEDSPSDRALYVWGCSRSGCQKKAGSVRAWRGLKLNEKYAAKLVKKKARQQHFEELRAKAVAAEQARAATAKINPFSMKGSSVAPSSPFGSSVQVLGGALSSTEASANADAAVQEREDALSDEDEDELLTAMASTTLENSPWETVPAYPPIYMSTSAEYLPPPPKSRNAAEDEILEAAAEGKNKVAGWAMEGYENSMDLDQVFERFNRRVSHLGEQCIRYELGGTPLPYVGDAIFNQLFPTPSSPYVSVTKPGFSALPVKRAYSPASVPACPVCKSKRVFECQLMPNLINVLEASATTRTAAKQSQTDQQRRKEIEQALKGSGSVEFQGMQWGTCMIFSCENDCSLDGPSNGKSSWREEVVLVQWDT